MKRIIALLLLAGLCACSSSGSPEGTFELITPNDKIIKGEYEMVSYDEYV